MIGHAIAHPGRVRIVFGPRQADVPASNRRVREACAGNRGVIAEGAINGALLLGSFLNVRVRKAFAGNGLVIAKWAVNGAGPLLNAWVWVTLATVSGSSSELTKDIADWWSDLFLNSWDRVAPAWWFEDCVGGTRNWTDAFGDFLFGRERLRILQFGGSKDGATNAGCGQYKQRKCNHIGAGDAVPRKPMRRENMIILVYCQ